MRAQADLTKRIETAKAPAAEASCVTGTTPKAK